MENITLVLASLLGFGAFVSMLVNVLKYFGIVLDGTADKWIAGFNLAGYIGLVVANQFFPQFDISGVDNVLGQVAIVMGVILGYVTTIFGAKLTYATVKGLPLIGKSNTKSANTLLN